MVCLSLVCILYQSTSGAIHSRVRPERWHSPFHHRHSQHGPWQTNLLAGDLILRVIVQCLNSVGCSRYPCAISILISGSAGSDQLAGTRSLRLVKLKDTGFANARGVEEKCKSAGRLALALQLGRPVRSHGEGDSIVIITGAAGLWSKNASHLSSIPAPHPKSAGELALRRFRDGYNGKADYIRMGEGPDAAHRHPSIHHG